MRVHAVAKSNNAASTRHFIGGAQCKLSTRVARETGAARAKRSGMNAVWLLALTACGATPLPSPPYMAQPTSALVEVPYPPPPARVETVPARPSTNATWIDGEWTWRAKKWLWEKGRWVVAPAQAKYSPWALVRSSDGALWEARGTWRDARGEELDPPKPLSVAQVSEGAVIDTLGDALTPGRTLPAPGEPRSSHSKVVQR
jgi:hypothetical protein